MRGSRFSDEQIIGVLREADAGARTAELCRRHGISPATLYNWKVEGAIRRHGCERCAAAAPARGRERQAEAAAGGVDPGQPRLEGPAPKKWVTPAARREAVHRVQGRWGFSERRACRLIGMQRSVARYHPHSVEPRELRERLRVLAAERRRFGYRRLWVLLRREGFEVNHKRVYRLYREEGLCVRRRKRKRMAGVARVPRPAPERANQRWSMDFVSDATGERPADPCADRDR